jgi:hypothetical protein
MGNRAVVSFSTSPTAPSIYLHWNGGRASIEGFLAGCMDAGYVATGDQEQDMDQIERCLRPFFARSGECLSIYRQPVSRADTDNWDNGWYILDQTTLAITGRLHNEGDAEEINADKKDDIRAYIAKINTVPRCRYSCLYGEAA